MRQGRGHLDPGIMLDINPIPPRVITAWKKLVDDKPSENECDYDGKGRGCADNEGGLLRREVF